MHLRCRRNPAARAHVPRKQGGVASIRSDRLSRPSAPSIQRRSRLCVPCAAKLHTLLRHSIFLVRYSIFAFSSPPSAHEKSHPLGVAFLIKGGTNLLSRLRSTIGRDGFTTEFGKGSGVSRRVCAPPKVAAGYWPAATGGVQVGYRFRG